MVSYRYDIILEKKEKVVKRIIAGRKQRNPPPPYRQPLESIDRAG